MTAGPLFQIHDGFGVSLTSMVSARYLGLVKQCVIYKKGNGEKVEKKRGKKKYIDRSRHS